MILTEEEKQLIERHRAEEEVKRKRQVARESLERDAAWLDEWLRSRNLQLRSEWTGGSGTQLTLEYMPERVVYYLGEELGKK